MECDQNYDFDHEWARMEESCLWAQGRPSFISCVAVAVIREEVCIKYTEKGKYVFLVLLSSCFEINFQQILPDGFYGIPEVPPRHRFFTNKNKKIVSCHNVLIIKYKNKLPYSQHFRSEFHRTSIILPDP